MTRWLQWWRLSLRCRWPHRLQQWRKAPCLSVTESLAGRRRYFLQQKTQALQGLPMLARLVDYAWQSQSPHALFGGPMLFVLSGVSKVHEKQWRVDHGVAIYPTKRRLIYHHEQSIGWSGWVTSGTCKLVLLSRMLFVPMQLCRVNQEESTTSKGGFWNARTWKQISS